MTIFEDHHKKEAPFSGISGFGGGAASLLTAVSGGGGWILELSDPGGNITDRFDALALDSSDNIYLAGKTGSVTDGFIAGVDKDGTVLWQKKVGEPAGGSASYESLYGITVSGNDMYVTGQSNSDQGYGSADGVVIKYNLSGVPQTQRMLGSTAYEAFHSVAVNSANVVYTCGYCNSSGVQGSYDAMLVRWITDPTHGTLWATDWQKILGTANDCRFDGKMVIDSSDNVYVTGYLTSTRSSAWIVKYNSSGVVQWQRTLGGSNNANFELGKGISLDSSNNIFIAGNTSEQGQGQHDGIIFKYDNSGTLQWQRAIGTSVLDELHSCVCDSSGNVYAVGFAAGGDALIVKYDASGVPVYQNILHKSGVNNYTYLYDVKLDSTEEFIIACGMSNLNDGNGMDALVVKLPADGSGTGTHGEYTYEAGSNTQISTTFTSAASSATAGNIVISMWGNPNYAHTDTSFTETLTRL